MNLLVRRSLIKQLNKKNIYALSSGNQGKNAPPALTDLELEPFKFNNEKDEIMYGYTMEELYGRRYGLKHSPAIQSEMRKDTFFFWVLLSFSTIFLYKSRQDHFQMQKDWETYIYHDMNKVRPLRDRKPVPQE